MINAMGITHTAADAIDVLKSIGLYFAEQREE